jgi:hypothetical protein
MSYKFIIYILMAIGYGGMCWQVGYSTALGG